MTRIALMLLICCMAGVVMAQTGETAVDGALTQAGQEMQIIKDKVTHKSFTDTVFAGGWMMIPLLICSLLLLAFVMERFVAIRRSALIPSEFLDRLTAKLRNASMNDSLKLCDEEFAPIGRICRAMLDFRGLPMPEMKLAVQEELDRCQADTNSRTKWLGVISGVSPLLGLMGTVLGMIEAFKAVAEQSALGKGEVLAGGISEALITTATGLGIAIPAYLFYHFFRNKTDSTYRYIESQALDFMARNRFVLAESNEIDEEASTKIKPSSNPKLGN